MTIFFFTQWYPTKYDAMAGLFVRKHAQAIAMQDNCVHVFYAQQHVGQKCVEMVYTDDGAGLIEHIIYQPLTSAVCEMRSLYSAVSDVIKQGIIPDIVHLNVLGIKTAALAYLLNKRHNIPFVLTEHWSGYLPVNGDFKARKLQSIALRYFAKRAACIMPVSKLLQDAMKVCGIKNKHWHIVPNVVDDFFFTNTHIKNTSNKKRILHVSCFENRSKNTVGIINAINELSNKRNDFQLIMVGTGIDIDDTKRVAEECGLVESKRVLFVGEQTPEQVKSWFDNSDIFLLFSNYEIAPVVISESLACGVPVVSSNVGFMPEVIDETMGVLVEPGNEKQLTDALNNLLDNYQKFDIENIKIQGLKYSYKQVGKQYVELYKKAVNTRSN